MRSDVTPVPDLAFYNTPVKACPHLFPKQATLYPETGDFVAENDLQQSRLFPDTKYSVSGTSVDRPLR